MVCNNWSVLGSIFEVASSKHTISYSFNVILKKFIIYFSPFDKLLPESSISNSISIFSNSILFYSSSFLSVLSAFYVLFFCIGRSIWSILLYNYSLLYKFSGSKLFLKEELYKKPN